MGFNILLILVFVVSVSVSSSNCIHHLLENLKKFCSVVLQARWDDYGYDDWYPGGGDWEAGFGSWDPRPPRPQTVAPDSRSLDEIHKAALAEGGKLIMYAAGDTPGSQDARKARFEKRFPGMTLEVVDDFSKYHSARIDNQLATNSLIPDLVQLQTLQDFPRWKAQGALLPYKGVGWKNLYPQIKDTEGAYYGIYFLTLGTVVNTNLIKASADFPRKATDLLKPALKNKLNAGSPYDDDAALFWYKLMVDKYGWKFVSDLAKQNVTYRRGTTTPLESLLNDEFSASVVNFGPIVPTPGANIQQLLETDPFVSWAQTAAIFKSSKRPEAAKLYISWSMQDSAIAAGRFPHLDNAQSPTGKTIWEYTNTNPLDFPKWVSNRAQVQRFRDQLTTYIGEVNEVSPAGYPGSHPTQALPH